MTRCFGFSFHLKWKSYIFIASQIMWIGWDFHSSAGSAYL